MSAMIACKVCGQVYALDPLRPGTVARCTRCGSLLSKRTAESLLLTAAFSLAALILYWPANLLPVLRVEMYGSVSENTVWQGCVSLYQSGDYTVAVIVFLASMAVPPLKILGLLILIAGAKLRPARWKRERTWMYRFIDTIGRWAMLDVFAVAILVSVMKLHRVATVMPGKGLLAYALVAVLTLLASQCFDPELIWNDQETAR